MAIWGQPPRLSSKRSERRFSAAALTEPNFADSESSYYKRSQQAGVPRKLAPLAPTHLCSSIATITAAPLLADSAYSTFAAFPSRSTQGLRSPFNVTLRTLNESLK